MMCQIRLVSLCCDHEFTRHHTRALVDQLIERMLTVGSRLAPDNGAGIVRQGRAIHRRALAVTLHFKLLEIGRKARQTLLIR